MPMISVYKRLAEPSVAARRELKRLGIKTERNKMTQEQIWKQWIEIANSIDLTQEAMEMAPWVEKELHAALLSAAYWHPSNVDREERDPHYEAMCEFSAECRTCARARTNGICWDSASDVRNARQVPFARARSIDRLYKASMAEYRRLHTARKSRSGSAHDVHAAMTAQV